jgi:hypothetical protein
MGIENIGGARRNIEEIWTQPEKLMPVLIKAISFLRMSGMNCSLYNFQNCILPIELRNISYSSISDWKREYLPECISCQEMSNCGGIFNSSLKLLSNYIQPIKN